MKVTLDELERAAAALWVELPPGSVVWLTGELGSGKTTFVQALSQAAAAGEAHSPTFALVHEYPSPSGLLVHVDCYRLRDADEALDLDFAGVQQAARLLLIGTYRPIDAILSLLIEWPEQAGEYAPPPDAHLHFTHVEHPDMRRVERLR